MHDISTIQIILVTIVAFVAGLGSVLDERQFHRPLVACTLTGLALGQPTVGIVVGGTLELIALGWLNVGAAMAPDAALASTVSTVIAVASMGGDGGTKAAIDAAISVAVPLAVAGQALTIFVRTIAVFFAHQADRYAKQANYRGIVVMHFAALGLQGLRVAIPTAIVAALASGDAVHKALDAIPEVITKGLGIAGGFIVVVGYAMVINMMKARKLMPFFFLGFVFATFATTIAGRGSVSDPQGAGDMANWVLQVMPTGVTLVGLGIVGACLAVIYTQLNPEFAKPAPAPQPAPTPAGGAWADDDLDDELD
ncbi:PTS mannose/fructose/sorbose transporter subunit IIC [Actinomyces gaoshouyii]|uniref:PTS mannose/fructose/sorbose transporter subunit IIC n=1 Tax=Actinomyces gaoshouyii TaxID=1960083 RepID=UPI0009BD10F0|nr:PTS mannose/fructose/sorbose transporter subunit IIC [Actinomyces gaoshouyii]ARD41084.1 PTS mannose/fructose/sorbose transporter subunit IIC [Actinomyces gaoshouyii]